MTGEVALQLLRFIFPGLAFLSGSLPVALLLVHAWAGLDIRQHGSGNPGASNVFRVVGPWVGVLVLILDIAKGALPVYLAGLLTESLAPETAIWYRLLTGLLAGCGHIWSPFMGWRGGKGVATFAGVFFVLFPGGMLVAMAVAVLSIAIFRYFSLGSILGVLSLPVSYFVFHDEPWAAENLPLLGVCCVVALLILFRHTDNLKRLIRGEELSMLKGAGREKSGPAAARPDPAGDGAQGDPQ